MKNKLLFAAAVLTVAVSNSHAGLGTVSVGATETQVLPSSENRRWVILQNNSANDIYIKVGSDTAALTSANGIKVAAGGGTFTVMATGEANPAQNAISALSATGTNALVFQEGNEK